MTSEKVKAYWKEQGAKQEQNRIIEIIMRYFQSTTNDGVIFLGNRYSDFIKEIKQGEHK